MVFPGLKPSMVSPPRKCNGALVQTEWNKTQNASCSLNERHFIHIYVYWKAFQRGIITQASLCNSTGSMLTLESTFSVGQRYCCRVPDLHVHKSLCRRTILTSIVLSFFNCRPRTLIEPKMFTQSRLSGEMEEHIEFALYGVPSAPFKEAKSTHDTRIVQLCTKATNANSPRRFLKNHLD